MASIFVETTDSNSVRPMALGKVQRSTSASRCCARGVCRLMDLALEYARIPGRLIIFYVVEGNIAQGGARECNTILWSQKN